MTDITFHIHVAAWVWPFLGGIVVGVVAAYVFVSSAVAASWGSVNV